MNWLYTELRQTLRRLLRRPGFVLVVVATLGLGLGVNTAIFSALHRLILSPLPFDGGDRLAFVWRESVDNGVLITPEPDVAYAWLSAHEAIEGVALWRSGEETLLGDGEPERIPVYRIGAGLPDLVRVRPILGRTFSAEEARERAPVALVSEGFWRARLGGRRNAIGAPLRLGETVYTVVGVMPERFGGFDGGGVDDEVWTPLAREDLPGMAGRVGVLVRLRDGATRSAASEELDRIARAAGGTDEVSDGGPAWHYRAVPPQEFLGQRTRTGIVVLFGAVTLVLLIACANIAALLLVRLGGRRQDLAVRTALGAPRPRLLGALCIELAVLAVLGGLVGVVLAGWSLEAIRALRPPEVQGLATLALSPTVLLYAAGLALATTALFGIAPALVLLRRDMGSPLRTAATGDRVADGGRARSALVMGQVALSVALLVGSGLLVRTVASLRSADLGFRPAGLLAVRIAPGEDRYPTDEVRAALVADLVTAFRGLPGVESAADVLGAPPESNVSYGALQIEGGPVPAPEDARVIPSVFAGPDFFRVIGAELREGRVFESDDLGRSLAVVDETFARTNWPGASPVGRRFRLSGDGEWTTVVGVVRDVAVNGPGRSPGGVVFYPNRRSWRGQTYLLRTAGGDPAALAGVVREAVGRVDPLLPVDRIETMRDRLSRSIATERFLMVLLTAFAGLALALSCLGLYGLVAYALSRRTREIGIRLALGAAPGAVRNLLIREAALLAAAGIALGLGLAFAGSRLLEGLLNGIAPADPLSFTSAAAVIGVVALLAAWLPTRRVRRMDPMATLRSE